MRFVLALFLAFVIPFNAACAAGVSVCDVLEGRAPHGEHLGHHSHAHDHAHDETANTDSDQSGSDHNHSHAHPVFSWMPSTPSGITPPLAIGTTADHPAERFVSATPPRLERPPRILPVA